MDPLSISASVLTLIQAAAATTSYLQKFIKSVRKADSRLSDLCNELTTLAGFFDAIDRSVKQFQQTNPLLSPINDDIWRQSLIAVEDCQASLSELEVLVNKFKNGSDLSRSTRLWRLTRITFAISLDSHAADIDHLRNKIHKSNCALQTMLSVFNVSLSLRSNTSQDLILSELAKLKDYIEYSIHAAGVPKTPSGLNEISARQLESQSQVASNLKSLAQAAKIFYSTATTTASSMCRSSIGGIMPSFTKERIHGFIHMDHPDTNSTRRHTMMISEMDWSSTSMTQQQSQTKTIPAEPQSRPESESSVHVTNPPVVFMDADADIDLEILFFKGLEDRATEKVRTGDIEQAEMLLEQAIYRHGNSQRNRMDVNRLRIQLAVCYIYLGKFREAEPLVRQMTQLKMSTNEVIADLLHALSVAFVGASSLVEAMRLCRQALIMKKRLLGVNNTSYYMTMGLLATIYDKSGESTYGDMIRDSLPWDFTYRHSEDIKSLVVEQLGLFGEVFGVDGSEWKKEEEANSTAVEESTQNTEVVEEKTVETGMKEDAKAESPINRPESDSQVNNLLSRTMRRFTTIPRRSSKLTKKLRRSEPVTKKEHQHVSAHLTWKQRNKGSTQTGGGGFPFLFWKRKITAPPLSKSDIRILHFESFPELAVVGPAPPQPSSPPALRSRSPSPRPSFKDDSVVEGFSLEEVEQDVHDDDDRKEMNDISDTQSIASSISFSSLLDEFDDYPFLVSTVKPLVVKVDRPDSVTIPAEYIWDTNMDLPTSEELKESRRSTKTDLRQLYFPPTPDLVPVASRTPSDVSLDSHLSDLDLRVLRNSNSDFSEEAGCYSSDVTSCSNPEIVGEDTGFYISTNEIIDDYLSLYAGDDDEELHFIISKNNEKENIVALAEEEALKREITEGNEIVRSPSLVLANLRLSAFSPPSPVIKDLDDTSERAMGLEELGLTTTNRDSGIQRLGSSELGRLRQSLMATQGGLSTCRESNYLWSDMKGQPRVSAFGYGHFSQRELWV